MIKEIFYYKQLIFQESTYMSRKSASRKVVWEREMKAKKKLGGGILICL